MKGDEYLSDIAAALCVLDGLDGLYHCDELPDEPEHPDPLDGLILTVLSQNTNDKNRDKAYDELRRRYPTWQDVASANCSDIEDAIRVAGLANSKAPRIKAILEIVKGELSDYTLKPLMDWPVAKAREFMEAMPGVGPKTAACVLVFDMCMPAFPVDTHVARMAKRLGWVPERASAVAIQAHLESVLPPERFRGGHLNMITHGRTLCKASRPLCRQCPVTAHCRYWRASSGQL